MPNLTLIKNLVPRSMRLTIKDQIERVKYYFPKPLHGLPHFNLIAKQVYPDGNSLFDALQNIASSNLSQLSFDHNTPLASIGSCFAEEFAGYALRKKFNYLLEEPNAFNASANWGRVYTTPSFSHIIDYSLNPSNQPLVIRHPKGNWYDPFRESYVPDASTEEEMVESIKKHRAISKSVLTSAKILVVTVGQNEAWWHNDSKSFHARMPLTNQKVLNQNYELKRLTVEENVQYLSSGIEQLRNVNPDLKLIFTVSPVPSAATFFDQDVVTRSFANKSILRVAVEQVVEKYKDFACYFPSFEVVLTHNPTSYRADNRHVTYDRVGTIFGILDKALNQK